MINLQESLNHNEKLQKMATQRDIRHAKKDTFGDTSQADSYFQIQSQKSEYATNEKKKENKPTFFGGSPDVRSKQIQSIVSGSDEEEVMVHSATEDPLDQSGEQLD